MLSPCKLFEWLDTPSDAPHAPFLDRARAARERGDETAARLALGGYLVVRLAARLQSDLSDEDEREGFLWQQDSTQQYVMDLPDSPEAAHLVGIVEAAKSPEPRRVTAVRMGLIAYAYYLEHEARFTEALDVLGEGCRTYGSGIPDTDAASIALFAGRLNRLLARWDHAVRAYEVAESAAAERQDRRSVLLSRLGRANVQWGRGNLRQARRDIETILASAQDPELQDVRTRAYQDLGVVLDRLGLVFDSLQAMYRAFESTDDEVTRCRILGDIGVTLRNLGLYESAAQAFEVVLASRSSFLIHTNAALELMDLESAAGNRVAFERRRLEAGESLDRMPPSLLIDYHYKLGVGLARFGQWTRARRALDEAIELAEQHQLNEWYFKVERVRNNLAQCPEEATAPARPETSVWEEPAVAEVALGLQRYSSAILA